MRPLLLFSLPRSGSTLAQRLLATHEAIATTNEPWLLLPVLYGLRRDGIQAVYDHGVASRAIARFCAGLPEGADDYLEAVRGFAMSLYARASPPDALYFLDKTPRYHLVADEVLRAFPDGRFIFLWRQPLAIAASYLDAWSRGAFAVRRFEEEIVGGIRRLTDAFLEHRSRVHALQFERLVSDPVDSLQSALAYLDLAWDDGLLDRFPETVLPRGHGDPVTPEKRSRILRAPLDKWKARFANPFLKRWGRHFLKEVGTDRLSAMGYEPADLFAELDAVPGSARRTIQDALGSAAEAGLRWLDSQSGWARTKRRLSELFHPRGEDRWSD